jgi:transcriptional regulator with GAF, ATPase, and Fis domain
MANLDLIGGSAKFRALLSNVDMVAPFDSAVLIQGETGTGKELVARAIHEGSPRCKNRFVALSCAAIPNALLESELFGCERGAFTGAVTQTVGRFQAADRGTLFLDEIGDLPLELQPKLLRVLQEKQFERLGGSHTIHADVRIVAATNQDLGRMVEEKKFRADLYYRLSVFPISVPPLRERRGDVRLLAEHFIRRFSKQQGKTIDEIPKELMFALEQHHWPGNIRQLQNVIERGVIMTTGSVLSCRTTDQLVMAATEMSGPAGIRTLADAERAHIIATLRASNWVVGGAHGAAAHLGLPRTTLLSRMQRLGISCEPAQRWTRKRYREIVPPWESASATPADDAETLQAMEAMAG